MSNPNGDLPTALRELANRRCLFVFPHPDDEVFSCLALFRRLGEMSRSTEIVAAWVTTGCPARELFTRSDDFDEYEANLAADFSEVQKYLKESLLSDTIAMPYLSRGVQEAAQEVFGSLRSVIVDGGFEAVFCCPLEGAHPDHDFTNALVGAAVRDLSDVTAFEYTSYHLGSDRSFVNNTFLVQRANTVSLELGNDDIAIKHLLRGMYATEPSLADFRTLPERFRPMISLADMSAYASRPVFYETWDSCVDPNEVVRGLRKWVGV